MIEEDRFSQFVIRFLKLLPRDGDDSLTILKGHLLFEEVLRELLASSVEDTEALEDAKLSFFQCACLVQAIYKNELEDWVWKAVLKLNKIRNRIAHKIEPTGLQEMMNEFTAYVEKNRDKSLGLRELITDISFRRALAGLHTNFMFLLEAQREKS